MVAPTNPQHGRTIALYDPSCEDCGSANQIVFLHGHHMTGNLSLAGATFCVDCETYGVCDHENTHTETVEVDTTRDGEHDTYEATIEICDLCETEVES